MYEIGQASPYNTTKRGDIVGLSELIIFEHDGSLWVYAFPVGGTEYALFEITNTSTGAYTRRGNIEHTDIRNITAVASHDNNVWLIDSTDLSQYEVTDTSTGTLTQHTIHAQSSNELTHPSAIMSYDSILLVADQDGQFFWALNNGQVLLRGSIANVDYSIGMVLREQ